MACALRFSDFQLERETRAMAKNDMAQLEILVKGEVEPTADIGKQGVNEISNGLRHLLVDVFVLYLKTKNFHWHMRGRHFRDYHLLLDEQSEQIFAMTDDIAERARKIGARTIRSVGEVARHQRLKDNDKESVTPEEMITELRTDNRELTRFLRLMRGICEKHNDVASASMMETWIDQTERRTWFLSEICRDF